MTGTISKDITKLGIECEFYRFENYYVTGDACYFSRIGNERNYVSHTGYPCTEHSFKDAFSKYRKSVNDAGGFLFRKEHYSRIPQTDKINNEVFWTKEDENKYQKQLASMGV